LWDEVDSPKTLKLLNLIIFRNSRRQKVWAFKIFFKPRL
jgi:hypothetical protein